MNPRLLGAALILVVVQGCGASDEPQAQPTVEADGRLSIPTGYQPRPKVDASRVDCTQYLAMNSVEVRQEARSLCASSQTDAERERNPYCRIDEITKACMAAAK